jgi:hypothetical protein
MLLNHSISVHVLVFVVNAVVTKITPYSIGCIKPLIALLDTKKKSVFRVKAWEIKKVINTGVLNN